MTDDQLFDELMGAFGTASPAAQQRVLALIAKFRHDINVERGQATFAKMMATGVHEDLNADAFLWASSRAELFAAKQELATVCSECGRRGGP